MRAHQAALVKASAAAAAAAAAGPSSSALPAIRHLSTKAQATRSAPVSPFQNLLDAALKPILSASQLLSPAPRKVKDVKGGREFRTPFTPSETSGRTIAKRNNQLAEATGSKVYNNRAHLIIRLIRLNRILSAMAAFVEDVANPNRTPFSASDMEHFVMAMRTQSTKHATTRPAPKHSDSIDSQLWRPARLDPSISAKSLGIPIQCAYAIAAVYDVCLERKIQPTAKMISAMLSSFSGLLSPDQMYHAAQTSLRHLVPPTTTAEEQDAHLRRINHHALSSFIGVFGRTRKPEDGEALLDRWAKAQPGKRVILRADESIDLTGWGVNVILWQSLVKSRVDADDLDGARTWLERYRMATRQFATPIKPEPYLAYMAGIRKIAEVPKLSSTRIQRVSRQIREAVRLMIADHVPVESSIIAFVLSFEARVGNVDGGSALIKKELSSIIQAEQLYDAELLQALFQIHKSAVKDATNASTSKSAVAQAPVADRLKGLPSSRTLIRSLVKVGEGSVQSSADNVASCRSRGTLNAALIATMSERDYPAAIVVLNLFERWRIAPSQSTYTYVVNPLVEQGHHLALSPDSGEARFSVGKSNLDTTLQSVARQGDAEVQAIRRAVGDQLQHSETFVFSARPASTLRQTQYLVRVLNRVCAAELRNMHLEGSDPAWLRLQENFDRQDVDGLSENQVLKRVKSSILAAQDELLGTAQERDGDASTSKPLLFRKAPTLSPKRQGFQPPPKTPARPSNNGIVDYAQKQPSTRHSSARSAGSARSAARAFSTSAVTRTSAESSGASCDLAAASSGDYTHLDAVRAIYIPGFVPYSLGLALQEHLVKQRSDARAALRALSETASSSASTLAGFSSISPSASESALQRQANQDTLLLLQHRPVYTEGRRHDSENTLVADHLRSLGADYHLTKRGGQITYHGPGQLVGYPIVNLSSMQLASRCYVDKIQDSLISLLASRGVETVPPPDDHTGVWADEYHKIASIGIQVRHRITSHGFALNVEKRAMQGFRHIVACGIVGRSMTCLQDRLDPTGPFARYNTTPSMTTQHRPAADKAGDADERVDSIAESYKTHFASVFGRRVRDATPHEFAFDLVPEPHRDALAKGLNISVEETEQVVATIKVDGREVMLS